MTVQPELDKRIVYMFVGGFLCPYLHLIAHSHAWVHFH